MNTWSQNIRQRDALLWEDGYQPTAYRCGLRYFDKLSYDSLKELVDCGLVNPFGQKNDAPCTQEFLDFMEQNPGFTVRGYATDGKFTPYRFIIDGCQKDGSVEPNDIVAFAERFRFAEEFAIDRNGLSCWYD